MLIIVFIAIYIYYTYNYTKLCIYNYTKGANIILLHYNNEYK